MILRNESRVRTRDEKCRIMKCFLHHRFLSSRQRFNCEFKMIANVANTATIRFEQALAERTNKAEKKWQKNNWKRSENTIIVLCLFVYLSIRKSNSFAINIIYGWMFCRSCAGDGICANAWTLWVCVNEQEHWMSFSNIRSCRINSESFAIFISCRISLDVIIRRKEIPFSLIFITFSFVLVPFYAKRSIRLKRMLRCTNVSNCLANSKNKI